MMNLKSFILVMAAVAGIGALIAFALLLGVQVTAQQQTMPADPHHLDNNSNQSGNSMTEQQQQQNTTTTLSGQVMMMNQTFTTNWTSLVSGVKVTGVSVIDTDHIAVNLRYDGEGGPPGVSVVAVAITNSSSGTIIGSMMQQDSIMMGQQGEMMMMGMIMSSNQQSNSSADQESQQQNQQHAQNSTSATNNSVRIMQSGSNYLEAGWQAQESNSATVLVQLDGDIPEGGHLMVMVFPFLHR